jgi:hypothetical protein
MNMADEDKSEAKAKSSYGEKMKKKLSDERKKGQANPTRKNVRKRAKRMRK